MKNKAQQPENKKEMLIAFPDVHDPFINVESQQMRLGPVSSLLSVNTYDYVVLFLFPELFIDHKSLLEHIKKSAPKTHIQVIDCSSFLGGDPMDMIVYLRGKLEEISPNYREHNVSVCLGMTYINLHAAVLNLCLHGELPCKLITVRPVYALSSPIAQFEEINFYKPKNALEEENRFQEKHIKVAMDMGIVGHESMKNTLDVCAFLAPTPYPILILGETGVGKGLFAKYVHALSERNKETFIEVNCAAIPENLVESVLFGHKKGSFTGAVANQSGKFVQANGGTLFLDEIGDMPMPTQAKILKVLEDGLVDVIGSEKPVKVDVKIIAATNCDLQERIKEGKFRSDLYFRLNVGEITIPPLNERRGDIRALAEQILVRFNKSVPFSKMLTNTAFEALEQHEWKGNVRELEMVLKRALTVNHNLILTPSDIFPQEPFVEASVYRPHWEPGVPIDEYLRAIKESAFEHALEISHGNQSAAARLLGVSHQAINQFLKKKHEKT